MKKALAIKQPFANQILDGIKTIELRNWKTEHRGKLWIYSGGYVIGRVILESIKEYFNMEEYAQDKDKHLSDKFIYRYGFVLSKPIRIKPRKVRGNIKLFTFE